VRALQSDLTGEPTTTSMSRTGSGPARVVTLCKNLGMPKVRWLNATVVGIGIASLFSDLSHETVTSLLPGLLASMGVAAAALGSIEGVADGVSTVAKLYGGWLADRVIRRKPLCASGYGLMGAATALIAAAWTWPMVFAGRCLSWAARGIRTPARKSLLADAVTPETYGRAFGLERTMDTLGAVCAPIAAAVLLRGGFNSRQLLWISTIPALLATAAIGGLVKETPHRVAVPRPFFESFIALPRRFKMFLRWVGLFGAGDFAHSLMILYAVTVLAPRFGAGQAAAYGVGLYAVHNVFYAAVSYPTGILADHLNKRSLLATGYALGAVTSFLLAAGVSSLPMLVLTFALAGAYVGTEETLEDTISAEMLSASMRGSGFGLLALVNGLGDLLSSVAVGWVWAARGRFLAFGLAGCLMGAGALAVWATRHADA
jgi:MFS family permease